MENGQGLRFAGRPFGKADHLRRTGPRAAARRSRRRSRQRPEARGPRTSSSASTQRSRPASGAGKSLKDIYDETYAALEPDFGKWVIFEHCMPFDVTRAYEEASGIDDSRIWTAERDLEMWRGLEQRAEFKGAEA